MTQIYELENHILIDTDNLEPAEHCHRAAHVIISRKDIIKVRADGNEHWCRGIMIPSGVSHRIETYGNPVLVFLYANTTNVAKKIQKVSEIEEETITGMLPLYTEFQKESSKAAYHKLENHILKWIGIEENSENVPDERIVFAMEYVRNHIAEKMICKEVADMVCLSEGRFSHLFKEQAGMTFSAYVICQRILKVYFDVIQGKSVTEAAIEAGFSSSAHFADVSRRVFGVSIRNTVKNLIYRKIT